jgi:hypothetical protein
VARIAVIAAALREERRSAVSLVTLMQLELGARIGEISSLAVNGRF